MATSSRYDRSSSTDSSGMTSRVPVERRPLVNGSDSFSTGRRHWVLTEESPRLTTMDDNNTLAVFAGYYTRSLFALPAFLNDVAVPATSVSNATAPVSAAVLRSHKQLKEQTRKNRKVVIAATLTAVVVNICFFIVVIVLVQRKSNVGYHPQQCQADGSNRNLTLKDTELFEDWFRFPAETVDDCVNIFYNNASCVAVTFCVHCTPDRESYQLCYMYAENLPADKPKYAVTQTWESVIIFSNLKEELIFVDTAASGVEIPLRTRVRTLRRCLAACLDEFCCVGFTFSPNKDEPCKLYSGENMSLLSETGTETHFVSTHTGKI